MRLPLIVILLCCLAAAHAVRLDVLVHPALVDSAHTADSLLALAAEDDAPLFVAGRILSRNARADTTLSPAGHDSLVVEALAATGCRWASPSDYHWRVACDRLLAGNVRSPWSEPAALAMGDSLTLGLLTIYSPDTAVRYPPGPRAQHLYDLPAVLTRQLTDLRLQCDLVLLLSNLPVHVLDPLMAGLPVDGVLSFDYKSSRSTELNGVPFFGAASGPALWRLRTESVDGKPTLVGERIAP